MPDTSLKLREKTLEGGAVPLCVPQTLVASLKNAGTRAAAFRIVPNPLLKVGTLSV